LQAKAGCRSFEIDAKLVARWPSRKVRQRALKLQARGNMRGRSWLAPSGRPAYPALIFC
jgi:hypothetical protein